MDAGRSQLPPNRAQGSALESLGSWKEIAAYLKRDERTVRRWEKDGLPIHRHMHRKKASIYAFRSEIDEWWRRDRTRLEANQASSAPESRRSRRWIAAALLALPLAVLALNIGGVQERFLRLAGASGPASITLAVLPLKNFSADPAQDYYADGFTDALITELGKIARFHVVSFQSASRYRQTAKPLPEIARELQVDAVLEGSVLRSGDRVRITTKLFQAEPERQLLSESYEFDAHDIVAAQATVARDVAGRALVRLTPQEQAVLKTVRGVDPEAYEAYLLGRAYFSKDQVIAIKGKEYYEKAVAKDPSFAPAYAGLAELYAIWGWRLAKDPMASNADARLATRYWAQKTLALDSSRAEGHAALAWVSQQEWDWDAAERAYRRAIEVNPSYATARIWYTMYLYGMERFDEAVLQGQRAHQLDPASPLVNTMAGKALFYAGRTDEAFASWQRALELEPRYPLCIIAVAAGYVALAKHAQAIAVLDKGLADNPNNPFLLGVLAHVYGLLGQRAKALALIADLTRREARGEVMSAFTLVYAYAPVDRDRAFARLEKAAAENRDRVVWVKVDPLLGPLRSDPRFEDLVRRMNFPTKFASR
jgi:TolB-like protein/Tfp pilus assembly protein PilF